MKQNVSETEIGVFEKMQKHGHFHAILNLPVTIAELQQKQTNTNQPTITNCYKELHLKCGRVCRSAFENVAMHES